MFKKVSIILPIFVLLLLAGCSDNSTLNTMGIEINTITSSIGAVGGNANDFEAQRFKYTMTLTNNDVSDIKIVSIEPVLSEEFIEEHYYM
jgi:outer membrane murein-binding lipoprotein Lpp